MNVLDNAQLARKLDPGGMREYLRAWPEQFRQGWQDVASFSLPGSYAGARQVVILGMGGSAMGGDLVKRLVAAESGIPVFVLRDYDLPAFVDRDSLVIASSYSGNTEEVLVALAQAEKLGAARIAISSGGKLAELATRKGIPFFQFGYRAPPRAGLGYGLAALLGLVCRLGLIKDKTADVSETIKVLEDQCWHLNEDTPVALNKAKQLAQRLYGRLVVIYGAGLLAEVAFRWKTQLNENSKAWAFCEQLPELNHNAVLGYQFPKDMAKSIVVVMLRSSHLHPRHLLRQQVTWGFLKQAGVGCEIVDSEGKGPLAQMISSVVIGDYASYYLAMLNKTDPTPVPVIEVLKKRLDEEPLEY